MLEDGGNAVDAAVTAAAVLCVCEPMSTGIGGDLFSIVWEEGRAHGLNSSGRAPGSLDPDTLTEIAETGPRSVTVPGAVSGWAALLERFGSVGLDRCLAPAIDAAEQGFAVTPVIARAWASIAPGFSDDEARRVFGDAPQVGQIARLPELGQSLRTLASDGPAALYDGALGDAICEASWLERADLAAHVAEWVEPLRLAHRGVEVLELPPNGQGAVALQALALVEPLTPRDAADRVHLQAEALKLAFADGYRLHRRRAAAGGLPRSRVHRRAPRPDRPRARGLAAARRAASRRHGVPLLRRRRAARLLAHPEPVLRLREWRRRPRGRGSCCRTAARASRSSPGIRTGSRRHGGRSTRSSRACSCATGRCSGRSASWAATSSRRGICRSSSSCWWTASTRRRRSMRPRFRLDLEDAGWTLALEPPLWTLEAELTRRGHRVRRDPDLAGFGGGQVVLVRRRRPRGRERAAERRLRRGHLTTRDAR